MSTANPEATPQAPTTVTILGDGQMGLVTAQMLADNGNAGEIRVWGRDEASIARLRRDGTSERLAGFTLAEGVHATNDAGEAVRGAGLIVVAIPTQFVRSVLEPIAGAVEPGAGVVSVSKGFENGTLDRVTQIATGVLGDRQACALSGPTIASELAARKPASMVSSSDDAPLARAVQALFSTEWLRIYTSGDLIGVETAGALKNVIAIAAGILDGLGAGMNAKSALLARGLAEITRLGVALGADRETFFGLAGVGDLATTCFSPEGRNRTFGESIGRGMSAREAQESTISVVEGVATTSSVVEIASRKGVEMPIVSAVNAILNEGLDPREAIAGLMSREMKREEIG